MAMAPCAASSSATFPARPAVNRPRADAGRSVGVRAAAAAKWWAPLVGWSSRADYIEAPAPVPLRDEAASVRGLLTEEKARELRARMAETECFHDAMYHSAIASRLARSS